MICPKCQSNMEVVTYDHINVHRCVNCRGLWFDMLDQEHLKAIEGSERIDIGDPAVGREYNKMSRVKCPACETPMIPMVDKTQPHLWYESCTVCYGVFFDAGEFKDYKEHGIIDFFKDLFGKERK